MAQTNKQANSKFRDEVLNRIAQTLTNDFGEEIIKTASNTIVFPFVNELNSEEWVKIVVSVPAGARDGTPFDGYEQGEDFIRAEAEKEIKKKEAEEKKKKQIEYTQKKRDIAKKRKDNAV